MSESRSRRLRAVLRNALTWGVAWAAVAATLVTVIGLFDPNPGIESLPERVGLALLSGLAWGVRFGVVGAVIGSVFAVVIRLRYRGRRLADINPVLFAVLGAVVGGVGVPLFLQLMNVLTGGPIAWGLVTDDAIWASVFGAGAAAGSILLARRADALSSGARPDEIERPNDLDGLPAAGPREVVTAPRSRSAQR